MLKLLRRFLVVNVLMFWQGGFLFYAAVVVPIGSVVLDSHLRQGFVTRQVTNYLNLAGVLALPILAWDTAASPERGWRRVMRWAIWGLLAITLVGLFWMHVQLDHLLDAAQLRIIDREAFYLAHRVYLLISTIQWLAALVGLILTLGMWRVEDGKHAL